MASIGPLTLKLATNLQPMAAGLTAAQAKLSQFASSGPLAAINSAMSNLFSKIPGGDTIKGIFASIGNATTSLLSSIPLVGTHLATFAQALGPVGIGIGVVAVGLGLLAKAGFDSIMSLHDMAEQFSLTAEQAGSLAFAFQTVGLDQAGAEKNLTKFTLKMAELADNPTGPLGQSFRRLGVDVEALLALPMDQQLGIAADAFAGITNQSERAQFGMQIFGKGWTSMRELMSRGSAGFAEAAALANSLGIIMSQVDFDTVNTAGNQMMRTWAAVKTVFQSLAQAAAIALAPALHMAAATGTSLVVAIQPVLQILRDLVGGLLFAAGVVVQVFAGALNMAMPILSAAASAIGAVWTVIKIIAVVIAAMFLPAVIAMGAALAAAVVPFLPIIAAVVAVIAALTILKPVIDGIYSIIVAIIGAAIAPFAAAFRVLSETAGQTLDPFQLLGAILAPVGAALNFVAKAVTAVGQFLGMLVGGALTAVIAVLGALWSILQVIVQVALVPFRIAWELILIAVAAAAPAFQFLGGILASVGGAFLAVGGAIRSVAVFLIDTLLGAIQGIIQGFGSLFGLIARIPGIGNAFTGVAASTAAAVAQIQALRNGLAGTGQAAATATAAIQQTAAAARTAADAAKLSETWGGQISNFGLSGRALEIAKLTQAGATEAHLEELRAQDMLLNRLEHQVKLREQIAQVTERARTPLQAFEHSFDNLQSLIEGGLGTDVAASEMMGLIDTLEKAGGIGEVKAPQALAQGSAAAVSFVQRAQMQSTQPTDPVERLRLAMEQQREIQERQAALQERMVAALESGEILNVVGAGL